MAPAWHKNDLRTSLILSVMKGLPIGAPTKDDAVGLLGIGIENGVVLCQPFTIRSQIGFVGMLLPLFYHLFLIRF